MLVTDRFVYIHQPKTGGTFVSAMMNRAHEASGGTVDTIWIDPDTTATLPVVGPGRMLNVMMSTRNQHGARRDIPAQYRDRPVVATVRNPYDRYVSQFEFAWWRVNPEMFGPLAETLARYPAYPDLTFEQFIELTNTVSVPYRPEGHPDRTPGFHTQQFVEYFAPDPTAAYPQLSDGTLGIGHWRAAMAGVRFLEQDRLNRALHSFLLEMGYASERVGFILGAEKILPDGSRLRAQHWTNYFSPALKAFVRRKEDLLFQLFPQFDV